ncbi:MAG: hypothetical protein M3O36_05370, partial [Myxococcota bacterium]|nr:hypothetical protein [Myxococcota bacterium]
DFELRIADPGLSMMYQSDDVYRYDSAVVGKTVTTAHILTGTWADVVTATNSQKPFTMCFHLRNSNGNTLAQLLGGWYATLGLPNVVDVISATFGPLANNDIIMPDKLVWSLREVASHEYGHYTLCNYTHEEDIKAIDKLIINTLNTSGNSLAYPTRYINEAFADLISGQVTSIANYGWVNSSQPEGNRVCSIAINGDGSTSASACFDKNFNALTTSDKDPSNVARIASMIHDAFDGHLDKDLKHQPVPGNADAWQVRNVNPADGGAGNTPEYSFTSKPWGEFDNTRNGAPLETVTLDGPAIRSFARNLAKFPVLLPGLGYLDDSSVILALDLTMNQAGVNWCRRCPVFELHSPANANVDTMSLHDMLDQCNGKDAVINSLIGSSPVDPTNLRIDGQTCALCADNFTSDANGVCRPCTGTVVGNTCSQCTPDVVIDGAVAPIGVAGTSFATTTVGPNQNCPGWFWLEVLHPDAFFGRGATSLTASLDPQPVTQSVCEGTYQLTVAPQIGASYVSPGPIVGKGLFHGCSGTGICFTTCTGLPAKTFASAGALPLDGSSAATLHIGIPSQAGLNLHFVAFLAPPPPK